MRCNGIPAELPYLRIAQKYLNKLFDRDDPHSPKYQTKTLPHLLRKKFPSSLDEGVGGGEEEQGGGGGGRGEKDSLQVEEILSKDSKCFGASSRLILLTRLLNFMGITLSGESMNALVNETTGLILSDILSMATRVKHGNPFPSLP